MRPEVLFSRETLFSLGPEVVKIPNKKITIAYGAWGEAVNNERLINQFTTEEDRKMIENTGITQRHHTLPPLAREKGDPLFPREEIDKQIRIGAELTCQALQANGWEKADLLVVTTSFPPCSDFPEQIAVQANLAGIPTKYYYLACNGAVAAWHDILRDEKWKEAQVVITAVEGLSIGVDFEKDLTSAAIFGNGAASLAFSPQEVTLLAGRTVIEPDTQGVIKVPQAYKLPPVEERAPLSELPDWYEVKKEASKVFAFSEKGAMMLLPPSEDPYHSKMHPFRTTSFFARIVPPVVCSVLEECRFKLGVFHQASEGILDLVRKRIEKGRVEIGKILQAKSPQLDIPWVLNKVGMGNVSSATTLLALAQLVREGQLPKGEPFNLTGFGVGASITSMVVQI